MVWFLRGPGSLGKGRVAFLDDFNIDLFNIPVPALTTTYKSGGSYTAENGTIHAYLSVALQLASTDHVLNCMKNYVMYVIPVV